jgi:hypothetical protein
MNVEIGTEASIFLFWEYLFQIFNILSLQCAYSKDAAVLCLTYPEEDADDDIRTVAGGGPADGGRQVPQEEGQPAG